jgi:hypothetical protein
MYIRFFKWRLCKRVNAFVVWTNPNSIYCRRHLVDIHFCYHGHTKWGSLKSTSKLRVYRMRKLRTWLWRLRLQHGLKSRYALLPLTLSTFGTFLFFITNDPCSIIIRTSSYLHASIHKCIKTHAIKTVFCHSCSELIFLLLLQNCLLL